MVKLNDVAQSLSNLEITVSGLADTVTELKDEVTQMKNSIDFVSNGNEKIDKTVSDISLRFDRLELALNTADQKYNDLQMKCKQLHERIISMESQSRRDNLLIDGIPESGNKESSEDCLRLVRNFLQDHLKLQNVENIRIVRCHRMGRPPSTGSGSGPQSRPRTIIMKFHWFGDRESVWQKRKLLKGTKLYLSEDYPSEISDRRKKLLPIMQAARRKGLTAFLNVDKLHIIGENDNRSVYGVDDLGRLPKDLDPKYVTTQRKDNYFYFFGFHCPLSNFHESPFVLEGRRFRWVEEYFFHKKAELLKDIAAMEKIRNAQSPAQCKGIGHSIKGDINIWRRQEVQIMKKALQEKFGQNQDLKDYLLKTGEVQLAEASPTDKYWGTGVGLGKEVVTHKWTGKNMLGKLLMELRTELK
jgi:ribA/ribD-fused uncharacterized protein